MSQRPDPWAAILPAAPSYADTEEIDAITANFYHKPWEDKGRFEDGFRILLGAVAAIAEGHPDPRQRATQALRRVQRRVLIGEDQAEVDRHV